MSSNQIIIEKKSRKPNRSKEEIAAAAAAKVAEKEAKVKQREAAAAAKVAEKEAKVKQREAAAAAKASEKAAVAAKKAADKEAKVLAAATSEGLSVEEYLKNKESKIEKRKKEYAELEKKLLDGASEENHLYVDSVNKISPNAAVGTLCWYFRLFLMFMGPNAWWTQPQAVEYAKEKVREDGGVDWNTEGGAKKNPDGSVSVYGDAGRTIERIRREDFENCWDTNGDSKEGPFRLNANSIANYNGSTKGHHFSEKIKKEVIRRSGGKCELCGHKGKVEIDHIMPREKGGESVLENANALCGRCNDRKCNKLPDSFAREELQRILRWVKERGIDEQALLKEFIQ
jgi:hypothetical protein